MERTFSTWRGTTRVTEIEATAPAPRRVLVIATPGRKDAATNLAVDSEGDRLASSLLRASTVGGAR